MQEYIGIIREQFVMKNSPGYVEKAILKFNLSVLFQHIMKVLLSFCTNQWPVTLNFQYIKSGSKLLIFPCTFIAISRDTVQLSTFKN
jgi:hypothetical protein